MDLNVVKNQTSVSKFEKIISIGIGMLVLLSGLNPLLKMLPSHQTEIPSKSQADDKLVNNNDTSKFHTSNINEPSWQLGVGRM